MDIKTIKGETVALIYNATPVYKKPEHVYAEIPELGDAIGVFRMKLDKPEEDYSFPEDYYAMINEPGVGAFEVEIPQVLIEMAKNPDRIFGVLSFIL